MSASTNHTPGPWVYCAGGGHACNSIRGAESVQVHGWPTPIGGVSNASYSDRICENLGDIALPGPAANAALICAAPELLAALKSIVPAFNTARIIMQDKEARDLAGEIVAEARAAIAKAEGRS
jgi:hypothetical protein